jgi:anti-sigma regulatory factor (Ser/Thr protein kinase)/anti-anti-sigma regulatory factor
MEIEVIEGNGHLLVRPNGLLSVATATRLRDTMLEAAAEEPLGLVCDLRQVRATSEGLTVLHDVVDQVADWPAAPLVLVASHPVLLSQLERLGLTGRLAVVPDPEYVPAALRRSPRLLRATITLPPNLDAPAAARVFVGGALTRWQAPSVVEGARWVVSELVTNAVVHARTDVTVRVTLAGRRVHLSVADCGPGGPVQTRRGSGLTIVEQLSRRWGFLPRLGDGTVVWAVLDVVVHGTTVLPQQAVRS